MSVLCNIYDLRLQGIHGIDRLSGLSGVKILHVSDSDTLRKIDFISELKRLVIT